jgi:hypothetical protein
MALLLISVLPFKLKMSFMIKTVVGILLVTITACSMVTAPAENRKAMQSALFEGMSKADLLMRLGDPYKIDHFSAKEELVYYETDLLAATFCLQYSAIRLVDGKVKEWGNQVCKEPVQQVDAEANKFDSHLKQ